MSSTFHHHQVSELVLFRILKSVILTRFYQTYYQSSEIISQWSLHFMSWPSFGHSPGPELKLGSGVLEEFTNGKPLKLKCRRDSPFQDLPLQILKEQKILAWNIKSLAINKLQAYGNLIQLCTQMCTLTTCCTKINFYHHICNNNCFRISLLLKKKEISISIGPKQRDAA